MTEDPDDVVATTACWECHRRAGEPCVTRAGHPAGPHAKRRARYRREHPQKQPRADQDVTIVRLRSVRWTCAEVADLLGLAPSTVSKRHRRAELDGGVWLRLGRLEVLLCPFP